MKKFLSIALALAMTLSLVVVGASATEYDKLTDKASIQHSEAVAVMNKLGIISGYSDGSFKPAASITRGAAAKIICMAKLGVSTAASLSCETAPFKDVSTTNTFAAFIAYCSNTKVVNGYNDGSFRPSEPVTGYAFAKMLLTAIGVTGTYTGTGWEINVAAAAQTAGLFDGIDTTVVMSKPLSRDNACQMALNAMLYAPNGSTTVYKVMNGETVVATFDTFIEAYLATQNHPGYTIVNSTKSISSLGYKVYGLQKGTGTDEMGRPSTAYTASDWTSALLFGNKPVATFTTGFTAAKLYSTLGTAQAVIPMVVNSSAVQATKTTVTGNTGALVSAKGVTADTFGGNGIVTEIYNVGTTAAPSYKAVQIVPTFAKVTVTSKAATSSKGAYTTYKFGTLTGDVFSSVVDKKTDTNTAVVTGTVANSDMVEYYQDGNSVLHINAVSTISGIVTAKTETGVYTIGGKTYEVAAAKTGVPAFSSTNTQTFYVDAYGYILDAKTTVSSTYDYALLLNLGESYTLSGTTLTGVQTATLAYPDGTVKTVNLVDTNDVVIVKGVSTGLTPLSVVKYSTKVNGTYLASITAVTGTSSSLATADANYKGVATTTGFSKGINDLGNYTGLYANATTKFVYADYKSADADGAPTAGTVTVKTGIANVATLSGKSALAVDLNADGVADVVYITSKLDAVSTTGFVYLTGTYNQTGASTYVNNGFVNGAATTITSDAGLTAGLYKSVVVTNGTAATTLATALTAITGVKVVGGLLFTTTATDGTGYAVTKVAGSAGDSATLTAGTIAAVDSTVPMYEINTTDNTCVAVKDQATGLNGAGYAVYVQMADASTIGAIYVVHA